MGSRARSNPLLDSIFCQLSWQLQTAKGMLLRSGMPRLGRTCTNIDPLVHVVVLLQDSFGPSIRQKDFPNYKHWRGSGPCRALAVLGVPMAVAWLYEIGYRLMCTEDHICFDNPPRRL